VLAVIASPTTGKYSAISSTVFIGCSTFAVWADLFTSSWTSLESTGAWIVSFCFCWAALISLLAVVVPIGFPCSLSLCTSVTIGWYTLVWEVAGLKPYCGLI
jgi:hypothetical protein